MPFGTAAVNVLAIECSLPDWSIAVGRGSQIAARPKLVPRRPISQALLVEIEAAIHSSGLSPRSIDLIGVTQGPGSFTGLRVGVTAAKMLAYALNCRLIGCNSLEVVAAGVAESRQWETSGEICIAMDAQRKEFFVANFRVRAPWSLEQTSQSGILTPEQLVATISSTTILAGPALLRWNPPEGIKVASSRTWLPDAVVLAELARIQCERAGSHDPFALVPDYWRPNYADEKAKNASP